MRVNVLEVGIPIAYVYAPNRLGYLQADPCEALSFVVMELEKLLNWGDLGNRADLFMTITQDLPCAESIGLTFKEEFFFKRPAATHNHIDRLIAGIP